MLGLLLTFPLSLRTPRPPCTLSTCLSSPSLVSQRHYHETLRLPYEDLARMYRNLTLASTSGDK